MTDESIYADNEELCRRTLCIWRPGQTVPGMICHFTYVGQIPCTGGRRCLFCGRPEPFSCNIS